MKNLILIIGIAFLIAADFNIATAQIVVAPPRVYVNPVPPVVVAPPVYANPYPVAPAYVYPYPRYGVPYRHVVPYHPYYHGAGYHGRGWR